MELPPNAVSSDVHGYARRAKRERKKENKRNYGPGTYGPTSPRQSSITTSNSPSRIFSPRFSSLRTPNTLHASEAGTPWQILHLDGFAVIHELVVEERPFIMRSYADGRCDDVDEVCAVVVVVVVVEGVDFDSFRLFGCRVLFDVGGNSATCERLGDRATVDVGEPMPSLRENTLSARLHSSPESKPESLVNVLVRFELRLVFGPDMSTPEDSEAASSSGGRTSITL